MAKAAVVLSGCGVFDGSEIHEAVSVLLHLDSAGAKAQCFAPDVDFDVINHRTGKPSGESRNALVEAARIARGKIKPLRDLRASDYDAVFFPGGFGAAKNLCSFASEGADCFVNAEVERVVNDFHDAGKPVGMCCIAPVIAAKVLGKGCTVTVGGPSDAAKAVEAMGAKHVVKPVEMAHIDEKNRLVTAPAYMYDAPISAVHAGIGEMVHHTLALVGEPATA